MRADHVDQLRLRLIGQVLQMPVEELESVERFLESLRRPSSLPTPSALSGSTDWPHAPLHRISEHGTYIVTAATYQQEHHFRGAKRLDALESALLRLLAESGWQLEARAVFSNHYHFVAHSGPGSRGLDEVIQRLHGSTSRLVNQMDGSEGRVVWHNYWDTQLTIETSYLARLNYVHHNAVKHGLVRVANAYRWCSAAWFERTAPPAQVRTVYSFKTDRVNVFDDFAPV